MYLTMQGKQAIYKETSFAALFLLEYYLTVISRKNYFMIDHKVAIATRLPLRSVADYRRSLQDKNLFLVIRETAKGTRWIRYCARKEGVYCNKYFNKLFGCNTVSDVCRKYSREMVADILVKENLNPMEVKDIEHLLKCYREK